MLGMLSEEASRRLPDARRGSGYDDYLGCVVHTVLLICF